MNCVFQVKTALDSVIAGRTIYLSTRNDVDPEQRRQALVSALREAVSTAQKKALALSRFQKSQEIVRTVQKSFLFQILMSILIILVT